MPYVDDPRAQTYEESVQKGTKPSTSRASRLVVILVQSDVRLKTIKYYETSE